MVTKEQLVEQRKVYEQQQQQALNVAAQANNVAQANAGAIEAIDWVLAQMEAENGSKKEELDRGSGQEAGGTD